MSIKVGIIGISGYTGLELVRLLTRHNVFELEYVTSRKETGKRLQELYPEFSNTRYGELVIGDVDIEILERKCQVIFLAVPHGVAMELVPELLNRELKVVDLSADFRLKSAEEYESWYGIKHRYEELLQEAVYGLIEVYREKIRDTRLVANPGCYPTSIILGLYPLLREGLLVDDVVIVDSKSGTTGAGRSPKVATLFCEVYDDFRPYNLKRHRHTPEIKQELSFIANKDIKVSFNPHLIPINRGIISTIYVKSKFMDEKDIYEVYKKYYDKEKWIRILPSDVLPRARGVRGSMYCDISIVRDDNINMLKVVTAIDNLCRGASGQAIANANLMMGLNEATGLEDIGFIP